MRGAAGSLWLLLLLATRQDTRPAPALGETPGRERMEDSRLFYLARELELVDRDLDGALQRYRRLATEPAFEGSRFRALAQVRLAELARDRADQALYTRTMEALDPRPTGTNRDTLAETWEPAVAAANELRAALAEVRAAGSADAERRAQERLLRARAAVRAEVSEQRRHPLFAGNSRLARLSDPQRGPDRARLIEDEKNTRSRQLEEVIQRGQGTSAEAQALRREVLRLERELEREKLRQARPRVQRPLNLQHRKARDQQLAMFETFLQGNLERARFHLHEVEKSERGTGVQVTLPANPSSDERAELIDKFRKVIESGLKSPTGDHPLDAALRDRLTRDLAELERRLGERDSSGAWQLVRDLWRQLDRDAERALAERR